MTHLAAWVRRAPVRWLSPPRRALELAYPFAPLPRVAVLEPAARWASPARVFDADDRAGLRRFRPEALAGGFLALRQAGLALRRGALELPELTRPLVVFSRIEEELLGEAERDELWALFGLPVYEQVRTAGGLLVAWECEAHAGYHVTPAWNAPPDEREECACGTGQVVEIKGRRRPSGPLRPVIALSGD